MNTDIFGNHDAKLTRLREFFNNGLKGAKVQGKAIFNGWFAAWGIHVLTVLGTGPQEHYLEWSVGAAVTSYALTYLIEIDRLFRAESLRNNAQTQSLK